MIASFGNLTLASRVEFPKLEIMKRCPSSLVPASCNPDAASSWPTVAGLSLSLTVRTELDQDHYPKGIEVTTPSMATGTTRSEGQQKD
jgi:hypothetical protein